MTPEEFMGAGRYPSPTPSNSTRASAGPEGATGNGLSRRVVNTGTSMTVPRFSNHSYTLYSYGYICGSFRVE